MLLASFAGGDRRSEAAARHHSRRLSGGRRGQLQRLRQLSGQPAGTLRQGLRVRQHFGDVLQRSTAQQGMADRQHQSAADAEVGVGPERIERGRDTTLHGVLHRDHRRISPCLGQALHHGPQSRTGQKAHLRQPFQLGQSAAGLLAVGPCWAEVGDAGGHRRRGQHWIGSCPVGRWSCPWPSVPASDSIYP